MASRILEAMASMTGALCDFTIRKAGKQATVQSRHGVEIGVYTLQAYLGSDSEDEGQDGQAQEAVSIEEYRRRLLAGAGNEGAQRKGGKDWGTAQGTGDDEVTTYTVYSDVSAVIFFALVRCV